LNVNQQIGELSNKNKVELANIFNVTQMTMIRAMESLLNNDLCNENKEGVAKYISFKERKELWEYLKKHVDSPVKETVCFKHISKNLPFSGISALSKKTTLADDDVPVFAISKKAFNKKYSDNDLVLDEFSKSKVEIWNREPILQENGIINPLDIFLICNKDEDERVQIELEKLLKELGLNYD
jgi:hypothetical protein